MDIHGMFLDSRNKIRNYLQKINIINFNLTDSKLAS